MPKTNVKETFLVVKKKKRYNLIKHTVYLRLTRRHVIIKLLDFKEEEKMP